MNSFMFLKLAPDENKVKYVSLAILLAHNV